jgi:glycosyltransferase involved in cell wall biosynthesis
MKLSILMPVHNEERYLPEVIKRVLAVEYGCEVELVIVDDGSTDATTEILAALDDPRVHTYRQPRNQGKGAAIRTAAGLATGDYMVIFDADLEYDPGDIPRLLAPVRDRNAQVVFGSHTSYSFWYVVGNRAVTTMANMVFNCYLSDLETCLKLMPLALYRSLDVRSRGFGMEAEVTCKLLRRGIRPYEIAISYQARTRDEGKKITWRDGVQAVWIILRERVRRVPDTGPQAARRIP